jgi:hypothetical protein
MSNADREYARRVLLEAFTAGWQAGLAVRITNPRVMAVVESCFDMWLAEELDEADVMGLTFRARDDLPSLTHDSPPVWVTREAERLRDETDADRGGRRGRRRAVPPIPGQRVSSENAGGRLAGARQVQGVVGRDLRRLLSRPGLRSGKRRDPAPRD